MEVKGSRGQGVEESSEMIMTLKNLKNKPLYIESFSNIYQIYGFILIWRMNEEGK